MDSNLNDVMLIPAAARGDYQALVDLRDGLLAAVNSGEGLMTGEEMMTRAEMFARLAAEHDRMEDYLVLAAILFNQAAFAERAGRPELNKLFADEAVGFINYVAASDDLTAIAQLFAVMNDEADDGHDGSVSGLQMLIANMPPEKAMKVNAVVRASRAKIESAVQ